MTLSELRQRWHEIKDRPLWDRERSDIESELFSKFAEACKNVSVYNVKNISSNINASRYVSAHSKKK